LFCCCLLFFVVAWAQYEFFHDNKYLINEANKMLFRHFWFWKIELKINSIFCKFIMFNLYDRINVNLRRAKLGTCNRPQWRNSRTLKNFQRRSCFLGDSSKCLPLCKWSFQRRRRVYRSLLLCWLSPDLSPITLLKVR